MEKDIKSIGEGKEETGNDIKNRREGKEKDMRNRNWQTVKDVMKRRHYVEEKRDEMEGGY